MFKLILMAVVGFIVYKAVKTFTAPKTNNQYNDEDKTTGEELIECSRCGTFTPRNEITFEYGGPVCKDCK